MSNKTKDVAGNAREGLMVILEMMRNIFHAVTETMISEQMNWKLEEK
ncbi:MAG: hypothetical protein PHP64_01505 [Actinomycetota bacterium]|nr:hypothetical protein [Actinomycetota bacterium]